MKKTTSKTKTSRKPTKSRKTKKSRKIKNKKLFTKINLLLSIVFMVVLAIGYGYFTLSDTQKKPEAQAQNKDKHYNEIIQHKMSKYISDGEQHFEEYTQELEKDYIHIKEKMLQTDGKKDKVLEDKLAKIKQDIHDSLQNKKPQEKDEELVAPIVNEKKELIKKSTTVAPHKGKARLAIIIDDVSYERQVKSLLSIGYTVNMSFLPPTSRHKNSAIIAKNLDDYMIHLPLQAGSFKFEETDTLHIGDSLATIDQRIAKIKKQYPKAVYINNHTGSKFTADDQSMDKLMKVLKKYNFKFIDSRTTAKTVAQKHANNYGVEFYPRNIFLDNKQDFNYIQGQLKKAIKFAQKTGLGIAIGHPHSMTIKVLKNSKHLLKDIELIHVNQI
ncbi:MAG: divergent polysaccharide deacetylase family protein [Campylobacterota bacterium]|nr:divergent polysaccharide deacetylase family protein [Campylobacterota bacterium]